MYMWCLTYFMDMHRDVLIVLKKSLKYMPVLGWVGSPVLVLRNGLNLSLGHAIFPIHIPRSELGPG